MNGARGQADALAQGGVGLCRVSLQLRDQRTVDLIHIQCNLVIA
jgi:hypothetical protein